MGFLFLTFGSEIKGLLSITVGRVWWKELEDAEHTANTVRKDEVRHDANRKKYSVQTGSEAGCKQEVRQGLQNFRACLEISTT